MTMISTGKSFSSAILMAGMLGACSSLPDTAPQSAASLEEPEAPAPVAVQPLQISCKQDEETVFSGEVQDEFGLTLSVCIAHGEAGIDPVISIRAFGEGGGNVISCSASSCGGIIEFNHYRRYRFTELTLKWYYNGGEQTLIETHDAQDLEGPIKHSITHTWQTIEDTELGVEAPAYPTIARTEALSMRVLDSLLPELSKGD